MHFPPTERPYILYIWKVPCSSLVRCIPALRFSRFYSVLLRDCRYITFKQAMVGLLVIT
jgi:hypothetical protein